MPETLQLLIYEYVPDMAERRVPHRDAHLATIERWRTEGHLVIAGAVGDPPHTGMLAFRGDSRLVAETFVVDDPYVAAGLVTRWSVEPWTVVTPLPG
jgi:uncharacterized protein YciI